MPLTGKRFLIGISGGIAAYKTATLARLLVKDGADVQVCMTRNATRFITPLTMESLSRRDVLVEMFPERETVGTRHIDVADWPDAVIVAPATANILAKMSAGIADDLLSTILLSTIKPILVVPAMNVNMFNHAATQANLATLRDRGVRIIEPGTGDLACRTVGVGRMAEPEAIASIVRAQFVSSRGDLAGRTVVVTAGPTMEPVDDVRVISNRSSGKMGYAVAAAARDRGARVVLISGPAALSPPEGVEVVAVESTAQMRDAVMAHFDRADALVMAAAVVDWAPRAIAGKMKKEDGPPALSWAATDDILAMSAKRKSHHVLVGFSLETDPARLNSADKLESKGCDLLVANDPTRPGSEFGGDTNEAIIFDSAGGRETTGVVSKRALADRIIDRVAGLCAERATVLPAGG